MKLKRSIVYFILFSVLLTGLAVFLVRPSLAVSGNTTVNLPNPTNASTFEELIQNIAKWFYYIMIPIASIMVLYAGFLFLTSGGDEEKIKRAKRTITWVIVGVAIILIGAGFITFVKSLLSVK